MSTIISNRVEITGQFNFDNPCRPAREAKVDRQAGAYFSKVPPNWSTFCDKIDAVLKNYDAVGKSIKIYFVLLYTLIAVLLVFSFTPSGDGKERLRNYAPAFYGLFIPFAIGFCRARKQMKNVVREAVSVCTSESGNGVQYRFDDEHWGGCNKPHVRRYFITVYFDEEEQAVQPYVNTETSEIETNSETFAGSDSNQYSATPNGASISSSGEPSLFDQLSSEMK